MANFLAIKWRKIKYKYMATKLKIAKRDEDDDKIEQKIYNNLNVNNFEYILKSIQESKQKDRIKKCNTLDRYISFLLRKNKLNKENYKYKRNILQVHLLAIGCELVKIIGDGNCLFRSISYNLFGKQIYHMYIRQACVEYMINYKDEYSIYFEEGDFSKYIKNMLNDGYWGDELCIKAIADTFDCVVYIITSNPDKWLLKYEPKYKTNHQPKKCVFLAYSCPIHYDSLKLIKL
ncbi:hypothetical protein YYG_02770 [Plasmodium vinckei petteri]|uniref:OTU domain-containing protein, putative n=2 Tax=Plasmodium vinckei TaxID=5860 RepID=W7AU25_PLAVN|nr:hypothetical protein YYG_02770 [Plasmodium vinckei petteri]CAD2103090.1 OTU domain-containing protein, putative [Plasmodium vinckei petteri]